MKTENGFMTMIDVLLWIGLAAYVVGMVILLEGVFRR